MGPFIPDTLTSFNVYHTEKFINVVAGDMLGNQNTRIFRKSQYLSLLYAIN